MVSRKERLVFSPKTLFCDIQERNVCFDLCSKESAIVGPLRNVLGIRVCVFEGKRKNVIGREMEGM